MIKAAATDEKRLHEEETNPVTLGFVGPLLAFAAGTVCRVAVHGPLETLDSAPKKCRFSFCSHRCLRFVSIAAPLTVFCSKVRQHVGVQLVLGSAPVLG